MSKVKNVFITLDGQEVPIKPISPTKLMKVEIGIENAYKKKGEPIDPPTYTVAVAGGGEEEHELDETSIESGDTKETERRQKAWDLHIDALDRMKAEKYNITRKIVLNSIKLPLPEDESWIAEQEENYIEVPNDPYERWIHWIETEILLPQEIIQMISQILELSATGLLPEEDVQAAKKLFLDTVYAQPEESEGEENTDREDAEDQGSLVAQSDNVGSSSSKSVGDDPE